MKTNIVGWIYIVASPVFFLLSIAYTLMRYEAWFNYVSKDVFGILLGILGIILSVFGFFLGSAIKAHKKWAWYPAVILISFGTLQSIFLIVTTLGMGYIISIGLGIFSIWALISEKRLFFESTSPTQTTPTQQQINQS